MIKAKISDKSLVISILSDAFDSNQSVNYVSKQDSRRKKRIKVLMSYSFEICSMFGEIYLSEDKKACALILYPERKTFSINSLILNFNLTVNCISIFRIGKVLKREVQIKQYHPRMPFIHLWFLGVIPEYKNKGIGKKLLSEIIEKSNKEQKDIYLETSTITNIPWYQKSGFEIIKKLDVGYELFAMRRSYEL